MTILLTGATGFIASHTWIELLSSDYQVVGIDNFCNSNPLYLDRISHLASQKLNFYNGDVRDPKILDEIFEQHKITTVVHFASLKSPTHSISDPLSYYDNNLTGLINLLKAMNRHRVKSMVFSSSAGVYGEGPGLKPVDEKAPLKPTSAYGHSKLMAEQILLDLTKSNPQWKVACLRYFNPIGAHKSGLIGEDDCVNSGNLLSEIAHVLNKKSQQVLIYGKDWPTPDGTGIRDYVHIVDLARAHMNAVQYLLNEAPSLTVNIGTGNGYSVLDVIHSYEEVTGIKIPYSFTDRRIGDVGVCYADASLAKKVFNWSAKHSLLDMCKDDWQWRKHNPIRL